MYLVNDDICFFTEELIIKCSLGTISHQSKFPLYVISLLLFIMVEL